MQRLDGAALAAALETLAKIESALLAAPDWLDAVASRRDYITSAFHDVSVTLEGMQLALSAARAQSAAAMLAGEESPEGSLVQQEIGALRESLGEELAAETIFQLSPDAADLFDSAGTGAAADQHADFPEAAFDLEESAKCLAFERWTAAVWHLGRGLERVLADLGLRHGILPLRDWSTLLAEFDAKAAGEGAEAWTQARLLLGDIRLNWASDSLAPAERYGEAQARQAYGAVSAFIKQTALLAQKA